MGFLEGNSGFGVVIMRTWSVDVPGSLYTCPELRSSDWYPDSGSRRRGIARLSSRHSRKLRWLTHAARDY